MPLKDPEARRAYEKARGQLAKTKADNAIAKKKSRAKHREKIREADRLYRLANRERRNAYNEKWRADNAEQFRAINLARNRANAGEVNARTARRTAAKKQAIPKWANLDKIAEIYRAARWMSEQSGEIWEVDHLVPLQNAKVCGLHCEANLEIVPRPENRRKSNRYWPDMW
jgi:hypothetical protein